MGAPILITTAEIVILFNGQHAQNFLFGSNDNLDANGKITCCNNDNVHTNNMGGNFKPTMVPILVDDRNTASDATISLCIY